MTSKIDSLGAAPIGAAAAPKVSGDKAATNVASAAPPAPAAPVDKLSLTGDAVRLQQLDKAASKEPVVDSRRVVAAKDAIAGGRYRVDAQAVAGKLSRLEWEMGGR